MRTFFFRRNLRIRLRRGQSVLLVCGIAIRIRRITLRPGEFVRVTCAVSRRTITVSCESRTISRGTVRLRFGEALIVRCRRRVI